MTTKPMSLVEKPSETKLVSTLIDKTTSIFSEYFLNNSKSYLKSVKGSNPTETDVLLWEDQVWEATEVLRMCLKEKVEEIENQLLTGEFY